MYEYSSVSASSYDPGALVAKLNEAAADGWDVVSIVPTGGDVSAFLRRDATAGAEEGLGEEALVEAAIIEEAEAEELAFEDAEAAEAAAEDQWSAGDTAAAAALTGATADGSSTDDPEKSGVEVIEAVEVEEIGAVEEPAGWAVAPETPAGTDAATGAEADTGTTGHQADEEIPVVATGSAVIVQEVSEPAAVAEPSPAPAPAPEPEPAPVPVPEPAPVVTTPAGWYPDPSTRYELRYWDGTQWTEHVARQGQQFTDPPVR